MSSTSWQDRELIRDTNTNLFCWRRPSVGKIAEYLEKLNTYELATIRTHVSVENLAKRLEEHKEAWEQIGAGDSAAFWQDVEMLVHDFLHFSTSREGTVHLKQLTSTECPRFHVDGYNLRLFTTYVGAGTQWLPEKGTNRRGLGAGHGKIVKNESLIKQMDAFEVGILKGEVPNARGSVRRIVHRSPELVDKSDRRIVLRIDI